MLQKLKTLIGFASKSGNISIGQEQVLRAIRSGKACLLIVAEDVSDGSKKKLKNKSKFYEIEYIELMHRDELSKCIGKVSKTCITINDKGFAESIKKQYDLMQVTCNKAN